MIETVAFGRCKPFAVSQASKVSFGDERDKADAIFAVLEFDLDPFFIHNRLLKKALPFLRKKKAGGLCEIWV
jgi:hypothetical protein